MDIREADPRGPPVRQGDAVDAVDDSPRAVLQRWCMGNRYFIVNKSTRARKRLMAKVLNNEREDDQMSE